jgi:hypothetical protein
MTRRVVFLASIAVAGVAVTLACGDMGAEFASGAARDAGSPDGKGIGHDQDADAIGAASGVVVLHAAAFPPFRLCFENYPDLAPQPDTSLMPEANVVGVEVGSMVRLGALATPPGTVYVINQREVRTTPRDPLDRKCGALLADKDFVLDLKYQVAGRIDRPLGVGGVDVLAITGCAGAAWLDGLGISQDGCGNYDQRKGSLAVVTVPLPIVPIAEATASTRPVQLFHIGWLLEATRSPGERLDVTFGALDASASGPLEEVVAASLDRSDSVVGLPAS